MEGRLHASEQHLRRMNIKLRNLLRQLKDKLVNADRPLGTRPPKMVYTEAPSAAGPPVERGHRRGPRPGGRRPGRQEMRREARRRALLGRRPFEPAAPRAACRAGERTDDRRGRAVRVRQLHGQARVRARAPEKVPVDEPPAVHREKNNRGSFVQNKKAFKKKSQKKKHEQQHHGAGPFRASGFARGSGQPFGRSACDPEASEHPVQAQGEPQRRGPGARDPGERGRLPRNQFCSICHHAR